LRLSKQAYLVRNIKHPLDDFVVDLPRSVDECLHIMQHDDQTAAHQPATPGSALGSGMLINPVAWYSPHAALSCPHARVRASNISRIILLVATLPADVLSLSLSSSLAPYLASHTLRPCAQFTKRCL
jgi:hypothetical protein